MVRRHAGGAILFAQDRYVSSRNQNERESPNSAFSFEYKLRSALSSNRGQLTPSIIGQDKLAVTRYVHCSSCGAKGRRFCYNLTDTIQDCTTLDLNPTSHRESKGDAWA
jgi:hypothetical protein